MTHGKQVIRSRFVAFSAVAALTLSIAPASFASPAGSQTSAPMALPASMPFADSAFENVWTRNDQPVAAHAVTRSWTWGPAPGVSGVEAYADAPDGSGQRLVQYFDKSRMEVNDPKSDSTSKWFVTNGLLTVELISGNMQVGNSKFEQRQPAQVDIASDVDDANAPTYASFGTVSNTSAGAKRQPDKSSSGYATSTIDRHGNVGDDPSKKLPETKITYYEKSTEHNVPKVFMDFLTSSGPVRTGLTNPNKPLLDTWVFVMGLPISDAYWSVVKVEGKMQPVMIQAFERRVLTYAPQLPSGWQVQMGNIGQHYFSWRYGVNARGPQPVPTSVPGMPARLAIPALGVSAKIEQVGVDKNNNMDIPQDPNDVAWFKLGTVPGNVGNSVIDGHLDWYGVKESVFYFLDRLKPGDRAYVRDDRGHDHAFIITSTQVCIYNQCPLNEIFGPITVSRLNLITCAGTFNRATQNYDKRTVVYSQLAP